MWKLIRREPNGEPSEHPWDEATRRKFGIDVRDVVFLRDGRTLFHEEVAYNLVEVEE